MKSELQLVLASASPRRRMLLRQLGLQPNVGSLRIILPVGISFYTFQTLSYTIDIYRRQIGPTRDPVAFFAFVCFAMPFSPQGWSGAPGPSGRPSCPPRFGLPSGSVAIIAKNVV